MSSENAKLSANDVLMEQILTSRAFRRLDKGALRTMVQRIELLQVHAGETIFRKGEVGDCFYIIRDGKCGVFDTGSDGKQLEVATLGPGDTFGEDSLIVGTPRGASIEMQTDGTLARLNKADFETLIKNPMLQGVSVEEAKLMFADGACIVDVRSQKEFERCAVPESRHVVLTDLRRERRGFDKQITYITVSDREMEAALAAFLIAQKGLDVRYLLGTVTELIRSCAVDNLDEMSLGGDIGRENVIELPEEYLRGGREQAATRVSVSDRAFAAGGEAKPNVVAVTAATPVQVSASSELITNAEISPEVRRLFEELEARHRADLADLRARVSKVLQRHQDRIVALEQQLAGGQKASA
ncbi:MAG: cyclic nucleotide-binding domain-containing protein [Gammaproteobacteria bacterium]